ncbi:hypothetical protein ACIQHU_38850 [Streptomyces tendae]|uniref:hypothetical protein n=1 Tax=Streptomyces tendae TaxID=1932 RepID=UPI003812155E
MPTYQTCRRHPEAGPFLAECYGCKRELFDIQARNEAEAAQRKTARAALTLIGTPTAEILSVNLTDTTLVVATRQPNAYLEYGVDVFRLPTTAETDPDLTDDYRLTPGQWLLIWQAGDHDRSAVTDMVRDAHTFLTESGLVAADDTELVAA